MLFETEHVSNPVVKLGDKVTAGQVIAEVSDYSRSWKEIGLGVVETGVFFKKPGNGSPWHACPMKFIDPRLKSGLLSSLHMAYSAWEKELGDSTLYDETQELQGCQVLEDLSDDNNRSSGVPDA